MPKTTAAFRAVFLCLGLALFAAPARAQPAPGQAECNARARVLEILTRKYKEAPVAMGVTNKGALVEVLSTGDGATWTIVVTTPQGLSCLVAAGEGWRAVKAKEEGPET